jgi:hypothetical protein
MQNKMRGPHIWWTGEMINKKNAVVYSTFISIQGNIHNDIFYFSIRF